MRQPLAVINTAIQNESIPKLFNNISSKIIESMDYVVSYRQNDKKTFTIIYYRQIIKGFSTKANQWKQIIHFPLSINILNI